MKKDMIIRKKQLALVVSAACLAMGSTSATAQQTCTATDGAITVSGYVNAQCNVQNGQSITVTNTGEITTSYGGTVGINVGPGVTATAVSNSGWIYGGSAGVAVDGGAVGSVADTGSINNTSTGYITGNDTGLSVFNATVFGTINNAGEIDGGTSGIALDKATIATGVTNSGRVYAAYGDAISVSNGSIIQAGGIINDANGYLSGYGAGISVSSSNVTGGILNAGHIDGGEGYYGGNATGIAVAASQVNGSIINNGTIEADYYYGGTISSGIAVTNASTITGDIVNSRVIVADTSNAVVINGSAVNGKVENQYGGAIYSRNGDGIAIANGTVGAGITNDGRIEGDSNTLQLSNVAAIRLDNSTVQAGGIANQERGYLEGDYGIAVQNGSKVTGDIRNAGEIDSYSSYGGMFGAGILVQGSTVTGKIDNGTTGVIYGENNGIAIDASTITAGVHNDGRIYSSYGNGIDVSKVSTISAGGIVNNVNGVISSANVGINVNDSTVQGGILNAGQIDSGEGYGGSITTGIAVANSQITGDIQNSGSISGGGYNGHWVYDSNTETEYYVATQTAGDGITVNQSTVTGSIVNSGTIAASEGYGGMIGYGGSIRNGITVTNASTITGDINNSGKIVANAGNAILVEASTVDGKIVNTGELAAAGGDSKYGYGGAVIAVTQQSTIDSIANGGAGTIIGQASTPSYGGSIGIASFTMYGGSIDSLVDGIRVDNSTVKNGIANAGLINGLTGVAVSNGSTIVAGGIENKSTGTITGALAGIHVQGSDVTGSISNAGIINAGDVSQIDGSEGNYYNFARGIVVDEGSTVTGSIKNAGTINATGNGIQVGGAYDDREFSIASIENTVPALAATIDGDIINSGTIKASGNGIVVQNANVTGVVQNSGTITAGGYSTSYSNGMAIGAAVAVVDGSTVDSIVNTVDGSIVAGSDMGFYGYGGPAVGLAAAGSTVNNGIVNHGSIDADIGIAAFESTVAAKGIVNNGTITSAFAGVLVDGATVNGDIVNNDTINANKLIGLMLDGGEGYHGPAAHGIVVDMLSGYGSTIDGSIKNAGAINASGNGIQVGNGQYVHYMDQTDSALRTIVTGSIVNSNTIDAMGGGIAVMNADVGGVIENSGTIKASGITAYQANMGMNVAAGIGIFNSTADAIINTAEGKIIAGNTDASNPFYYGGPAAGVALFGATVNNGITNAGTIEGMVGVIVQGSKIGTGGIVNKAGAKISGAMDGMYIAGSSVNGDVINRGSIDGAEGSAVMVQGQGMDGSASINGDFINEGSITGNGYGAVGMMGATVTGSVVNSGVIRSTGHGSGLSMFVTQVAGALRNEGSIENTGMGNAVELRDSTVESIVNTASGTIAAKAGSGLVIDGSEGYSGLSINDDSNSSVTQPATAAVGGILNQGTISGALAAANASDSDDKSGLFGMMKSSSYGGGMGIELSGTAIGKDGIVNEANATITGQTGIGIKATQIAGGLVNTGTIKGENGGVSLTDGSSIASIVNSKLIAGGAGAGVLVDASSVATIDNSGTISGAKAIVINNPTAAVTVNNSGVLDGGATITGGVLNLNGNNSRVIGAVYGGGANVNVNGTFTSEGAFDVASFNIAQQSTFNARNDVKAANGMTNSGKLSVLAVRPFTMTGDYTQSTDGVYAMEAVSMSSYSQMTVTGAANLPAQAKIDVDATQASSLSSGGVLAGVIKAGSLNASSFDVKDNSQLFNFEGAINGNNVDLHVKSATTVYTNTVENQNFPGGNAAQVLDTIIASNPSGDMANVVTALGRLTTSKEVSDAVTQTLPVLTGATTSALSGSINTASKIVQARQEANLGLSAGDGFITDRQLWAKPFGSWSKQSDRDGISGYKSRAAGVVFGADGVVSSADRLGVAFAYAKTDVDSNTGMQGADIESYQAVLYGSHGFDERTDLSWQLEAGTNGTDAHRSISFGGLNRRAESSYDGVNVHAGVSLGRVVPLNETTNITPSVRLDYTTIKNDSYTETGADALNLNVKGQRSEELVLGFDSKLSHQLSKDTVLVGNLGFGYDLMGERSRITSSYVGGGAAFSTEGMKVSPWSLRGGAGMVMHAGTGMEVTARYDVDVQRSFTNQTVSVKLRKAF